LHARRGNFTAHAAPGGTLEFVNPADIRVVFMGSPAFAVPPLRALADAGYNVVAAMCQPDRPSGRGGKVQFGPVKSLATELGIPVYQPEKLRDPAVTETVAAYHPGVFVVAAYGKIIPITLLDIPARGSVNVQGSLLPRWRGASPIEAAILAGDEYAGVSIMEVVQKMDAGAVVRLEGILVRPDHTGGTLEAELSELGARLLAEALPGWYDRTTVVEPQDEALVTYCTLIKKEDGALTSEMTADRAWRSVRAFNPWPGAFVGLGGERVTIWEAHLDPEAPLPPAPGALAAGNHSLAVGFTDGWMALDVVQRPGGKRQAVREYLNGLKNRGGVPEKAVLA
jgi:methionyl-tRNA formyltransferase